LNFIFGIVCLFVCVCAFSLRRESPDMILGDKPLIFEVVLSQMSAGGEATPGRETEETTPVGLTWILLDQKIKKIHAVDSVIINRQWRFKATMN
jgi:hypothetical protein